MQNCAPNWKKPVPAFSLSSCYIFLTIALAFLEFVLRIVWINPPIQVNNDVFIMGFINMCVTGALLRPQSLFVAGIDTNNIKIVGINKFVTAQVGDLSSHDQMQQIFRQIIVPFFKISYRYVGTFFIIRP